MSVDPINPKDLGPASGFSHGQLGREGGRVLFVAGQIGVVETEAQSASTEASFVAQFDEALRLVLRVVEEAGGAAGDVGRMTVFVTDMDLYRRSRKALGPVWKTRMGRHYPAMALVEVKSLVDPRALVEIEATAVIGGK
jgi:enamine deaminase RidA (YjgF/YER057c/UK114 family)